MNARTFFSGAVIIVIASIAVAQVRPVYPAGAVNQTGTNTGDVTLGTANGLTLSNQVLSFGIADAGIVGNFSASNYLSAGMLRLISGTPWTEGLTGTTSEILMGNGTVDSPGVAFYTGNTESMGIDATRTGGLRFLRNPNTASGALMGSIDRSGNFGAIGYAYFNQQSGKHASTALQVDSTTQGAAIPRMTTAQKNAISSPLEGLIVYDITLHKLCVYTGSAWETVTSS